jgi:hypothetical protein
MRHVWIALTVVMAAACAGCRTATRVIDEGRVDIDMPERGNRGYLIGSAPPWEGPKSTVRKMVEMEIEIPPLRTPPKPPEQDSGPLPSATQDMQASPAADQPPYTK